jgi:hypothetical protein
MVLHPLFGQIAHAARQCPEQRGRGVAFAKCRAARPTGE